MLSRFGLGLGGLTRGAGGAGLPPLVGIGYVGVNLTGPEYAWGTTPSNADLDYLAGKGVTLARIPTAWERWVWGNGLGGALNTTYKNLILDLIQRCWTRGIATIIDVHNYGRFDPNYDPPQGSPAGTYTHGNPGGHASSYVLISANLTLAHFTNLWSRIATAFVGTPGLVGYGLMNEPHDLLSTNLITNGNAMTGASWFVTNAAVLTSGQPDRFGTNTAWKMTSGTGFGSAQRSSVPLADGVHTISFEAKTLAGTQNVYANYEFGATGAVFVATTAWQTVIRQVTAVAGSRTIGMQLNAPAGQEVLIRNLQIEPGSSYTDLGPGSTVQAIMQAARDAIRLVDTNTYILVGGDAYSRASDWTTNNANLVVTDAQNKLIYEAHVYFDADASGQYAATYDAQPANPTIGVTRLSNFTNWLTARGFKGFIGEIGVPGNQVPGDGAKWATALGNAIDHLQAQGVPFTYWEYGTHQASDPVWWPAADPMFIGKDDADQTRALLLRAKAKAGPFSWSPL